VNVPETTIDARVFIDEAYDDNHFVLCAVIIPEVKREKLSRAWLSFQQSIRATLRLDYPLWQKYEAQNPEAVPEIHAVNLWQSKKYYRKYPHPKLGFPNPERYWEFHERWLGDAFELQSRFWLPVLTLEGPANLTDPNIHQTPFLSDAIKRAWREDLPMPPVFEAKFPRIDALQKRPYTWALPQMLFHIEAELRARGWRASVVCDDDAGENQKVGENSGFRLTRLLEFYFGSGRLKHIVGVDFAHSHLEAGLQIADIHAYAIQRIRTIQNGHVTRKPNDSKLEAWAHQHTSKQQHLTRAEPLGEQERGLYQMLAVEYIMRNSGLPHNALELVLPQIIDSWARLTEALKEN
jgi:hypothetical protein